MWNAVGNRRYLEGQLPPLYVPSEGMILLMLSPHIGALINCHSEMLQSDTIKQDSNYDT